MKIKMSVVFITAFLLGAIIACNGTGNTAASSSSGSGNGGSYATVAQMAQLRVIGYAHGGGSTRSAQTRSVNVTGVIPEAITGTSPCTNLGVALNQTLISTSVMTFESCTGYIYDIDAASGDVLSVPYAVFYDAAGCTGNAYLGISFTESGVLASPNSAAIAQGIVFVDSNGSPLMVTAGETVATQNVVSLYYGGSCSDASAFAGSDFYSTQDDNATITGVGAASYAAPITLGAPQ